MDIYIKTMTGDDDKEVVAQACTSVAEIIKDYGYAAIEPCKDGRICSPPPPLSLSLS
jgi:hypothetical protein